jgi:hypothetical protein
MAIANSLLATLLTSGRPPRRRTGHARPRRNRADLRPDANVGIVSYRERPKVERLLTADELAERLGMKTGVSGLKPVPVGSRTFASADTGGSGSQRSSPGCEISRPGGPGGLRLRNAAPSLCAGARSSATPPGGRPEARPRPWPRRCSLGGRGEACARAAAGGGLAAAAFASLAGTGRHRLRGDCALRSCRRNRDEDQSLRRSPSRPRARRAVWLSRRRRRWCRHGALAVLCLVRARGVQRLEDDVLVASIDRLTLVLRSAVGAVVPAVRSGEGWGL